MKKKLLGIFVCMLLIATMAIPISALNKEHIPNIEPISKDADVPVWEKDDSWTYELKYYESNINGTLIYTITGDSNFTVVDDTGDSYTLEVTGEGGGVIDLGRLGLKTTRFTTIGAEQQMRKTDLGLEKWYQYLKGICLLTIGGIPLPIPIQVHGYRNTEFNPAWVIMPFPLYDGKNGTLGSVEFVEESSTSLFWGLIPITSGTGSWGYTGLPYNCSEEQITVPAGTFTTYNVSAEYTDSIARAHYRSYYAEEVGNVVKESIYIEYSTGTTYLTLDLELKSTNYTP